MCCAVAITDVSHFVFLLIIQEHCTSCKGSGVVDGIKEVKVTIPAGLIYNAFL